MAGKLLSIDPKVVETVFSTLPQIRDAHQQLLEKIQGMGVEEREMKLRDHDRLHRKERDQRKEGWGGVLMRISDVM